MNAEVQLGFDLIFEDEAGIEHVMRIEGRADRFDVHLNNHEAEVIDYKHQRLDKISLRSQNVLEDPQLLIYARAANESQLIAGCQVNHAAWVALKLEIKNDNLKVPRALAIEQMPILITKFDEQLTEDMSQLWSDKPLTAFAPDGVCLYCEARGICRKGMW